MSGRKCLIAMIMAASVTASQAATRFDQFTERFRDTPHQAKVVAATCFGGAGVEWFAGGGLQSDGTIVAAGTCLGPTLDAPVAVTVLGADNPPPPMPQRTESAKRAKDGSVRYEKFGWTSPNATGFVVRYAADMKAILSVSRLPWGVGGVTAAVVDAGGNIFIAGPATDGITKLAGVSELSPIAGEAKGSVQHVYLARLSPDAGKVVWVRHIRGSSAAPQLRLSKGRLVFASGDLRIISPDGKQEKQLAVPGGMGETVAVSPIDGTIARGGEHHWATGREPYRDATLNIYKPDGQLLYELYNWPGPYVGLDNLRLVSDSAVRGVQFDDDGNLFIHAWSDGGNSVMVYQPNDVRTAHGAFERGLGMTNYGANVMSTSYLLKIDPKDCKVVAGTLWVGYLQDRDKPNSTTIDTMHLAADGSVCFTGSSAWGLIRTGNQIAGDSPPAGPYAAIVSADFKSLRYCTNLPACGQSDVNGNSFAIVSGSAGGRTRVLVMSGAIESESNYNATKPPPMVNAVQPTFGGGVDGHILVLDLAKE